MPPWDSWSVAGISLPLPPERSEEHETVEVARWQRTFSSGVDTAEAGRAWDAWAAEHQLRTVDGGGPHALGLRRVYAIHGVTVFISFCRMPGEVAKVVVHVERLDDLPRTRIESGRLIAHGLVVPLPPGVEPELHDDLTDVGGEDYHDLRAPPGLDLEAMLALYLPWASTAGLVLAERDDGPGSCSLSFRRPEGGHLTVCCDWRGGDVFLRFAFGGEGDPSSGLEAGLP